MNTELTLFCMRLHQERDNLVYSKNSRRPNLAAGCQAFPPYLLRLEDRAVLEKGNFSSATNDEVTRSLDEEFRFEVERTPFPFYSDPSVQPGTIECRKIIPLLWKIKDEEASVRLYHAEYDDMDLSPPEESTYGTFRCWLRTVSTKPETDRHNIKSIGIRMNDEDFAGILSTSKHPMKPNEPAFRYLKLADLIQLGVEPPPKPEYRFGQKVEDRIACDAFGRQI